MSVDEQNSTPICTVDPYEHLHMKRNPDGTITRLIEIPSTPASSNPNSSSSVLTKDFPLNSIHKTSIRVFLPKIASKKLPIIVYYHGGGFVICHADSTLFHAFCSAVASHAPAIVVSVDYRLAPENRLPAAYVDAVEALHWIRDSANQDEWFSKYGDYSNCFLMGSSSGGNIAYRAALNASAIVDDLQPLKIKGLILHHPFFGGSDRTGSELRLVNNPTLPLSCSDLFWELALPVGVNRDHEFCNPVVGGGPVQLSRVKELGWRFLVLDCSGDPLVDRALEFVKVLEERGVSVKGHFTEGDYHGVEIIDFTKIEPFLVVVKDFLDSCLED